MPLLALDQLARIEPVWIDVIAWLSFDVNTHERSAGEPDGSGRRGGKVNYPPPAEWPSVIDCHDH
jgi:hypothetical protein